MLPMPRFRVKLSGSNFLLNLDGEHAKFGFRTIRIVSADSVAEAEKMALILIHQDLNQSRQIIKNIPDAHKVVVESVEKAGWFCFSKRSSQQGFDFYHEDESPEPNKDQC